MPQLLGFLSGLFVALVALTMVGVVVARSMRRPSNPRESTYISQDISEADFIHQQSFLLQAAQDEDAPLKILEATVSVISGEQYQALTSSKQAAVHEAISVPRVVLQNVSDKTVVGITLIISDKAAKTKRGFYIKEQSIKPGQRFTILPENFIRVGGNPARNPKFWLDAADKSQVSVRVVAFFEDGSLWVNKDQR